MTIRNVVVTPVNIPLEAPIRWAWGVRTGITRNIIRVMTDDGLVGLGETMGGGEIRTISDRLGREIIGENPFNLEKILSRFQLTPYFSGYGGLAAIGGLEMALWDLMGKATGRSLYELIGGLYRSQVPFSAYVFYRYPGDQGGGETTPEEIVAYCQELIKRYGFSVLKLKGGVFPPEHDVATVKALRETFGKSVQIRVDPNGVWSPQTSLRIGQQLLEYDLEYLEDPTSGIEGMARLRRDLPIPLATNMCVVDFEQIPQAVRLSAVDIILGDPHKWGGIWATKQLAAVCRTFQLGLSLHSGVELGISTAAYLHIAASTPQIAYAIDAHYHHQVDDIIVGGKLNYVNGCMTVPSGPGLGVELDEDKFRYYAELHTREGVLSAIKDPRRPDWVPGRTLW
ncbi:MAG: hypothetical protein M1136_11275 [Chloroflexi bacterium]|nr:hypothetical protein [Chloroflexota bacterium]